MSAKPALPTGIVTFLFTDIEGSTRLLRRHGANYKGILADHRRILRDSFERHRGVEVDTQGDAFFAVFANPSDAVAAAEDARSRLEIPVRMGIHTGEPESTAEGYIGEDVHLGARIAASGHGGQVLVSSATAALVDRALTELGEHRLKDFPEPVALFQLGQERFPPLKTISNTNLPRPASSFVGRESEIAEIAAQLQDGARMLTLSGPGGSGKTRLAIEAASELITEFKSGVFWVGLAALRDPDLVMDTIAQTLGAKDAVAEHIADREMLLLLDNFEQVIEAAPDLASLVEACSHLRLLVTSRERLRVRGEVEHAVSPLAVQDAVELFCARSGLKADETIGELCRRLDNLPLAVELAAARTSVLSPTQILERLSQRLDVLKGGRDAEARQKSLRATIEWSYALLDDKEKRLFRRLAVFRGGCTFGAAEKICDADLDTLQSLVDKSLLRHTEERFWTLETIREFAVEKLDESQEAERVRERHAAAVLTLAEEPEREMIQGEAYRSWDRQTNAEYDNLRAALAWSANTGRRELSARFAVALWPIWFRRGAIREARRWIDAAVQSGGEVDGALRARLIDTLGSAAVAQGETERARHCFREALLAYRELGDTRHEARMALMLANLQLDQRHFEEATRELEEAAELYREVGHKGGLATVINSLAIIAHDEGKYRRARSLYEEALILWEEVGTGSVFVALANLAQLSLDEGDPETAAERGVQALRAAVDSRQPGLIAYGVGVSGLVLERLGSAAEATRLLGASDALLKETGETRQQGEQEKYVQALDALRGALSENAFLEEWRSGTGMSQEHAVAYAIRLLA